MSIGAIIVTIAETTAKVRTLTLEIRYAVAMLVAVPMITCGMKRIELCKAGRPSTC